MRESIRLNRRRFLGWTATGAAGLLLPSVVRPAPKVFDMGRGLVRSDDDPLCGLSAFWIVQEVRDARTVVCREFAGTFPRRPAPRRGDGIASSITMSNTAGLLAGDIIEMVWWN